MVEGELNPRMMAAMKPFLATAVTVFVIVIVAVLVVHCVVDHYLYVYLHTPLYPYRSYPYRHQWGFDRYDRYALCLQILLETVVSFVVVLSIEKEVGKVVVCLEEEGRVVDWRCHCCCFLSLQDRCQ